MRDRGMAKLFSFSCISAGTAALPPPDGQKPPKTPESADAPPPPTSPPPSEGEELERTKKRHSMIHKFMKSFSHLFNLSREDDDEDEDDGDEEEREMVIGFPTDVQHVAHIGWDGFTGATTVTSADAKKKSTTNSSWAKGPELLSLDSLSLKQFQAAMATLQAAAGDTPSPPLRPSPSRPSPPPLRHRSFGN